MKIFFENLLFLYLKGGVKNNIYNCIYIFLCYNFLLVELFMFV